MPGNINEPTPKEFIYSFAGNWASIISGGLSVPFTILSLYSNGSHGKLFFRVLAVFGIVFSSYKMWAREREEWIKTSKQLDDEIAKQGRPKITLVLHTGEWSELFICLTNYTDSPAVNLRADDIQSGAETFLFDPPAQVSSGFSPNVPVYRLDESVVPEIDIGRSGIIAVDGDRNSKYWIGAACRRKEKTECSEEMLISLRYTDQEGKQGWVTSCKFVYNFVSKRFVVVKQWVEASAPSSEPAQRPTLTYTR